MKSSHMGRCVGARFATCGSHALMVLVAVGVLMTDAAAEEPHFSEADLSGKDFSDAASWQLQWHNDAFANSDNQFSNGLSLRKHSALFAHLDDTRGTPAFGKGLASLFLPDSPGLSYRESWAFGQNFQTPDKLAIEELTLNDVPYVAMMGWSNSYAAFDDERFIGFGMMLGWVGEEALGEEAQKAAHEITGATDPKGWDNQLDFEPLINLYYMKKRKLWQMPRFDGAIGVQAGLGNFFTFAETSMELRFGDAPEGFAFAPMPVGHGLDYDSTLRRPGERYTYLTFTATATAFGHALPRDGNTFRDDNEWTENNTIDPEDLVGQVVVGLHHERVNWGFHLSFWFVTDTVGEGGLFETEDPQNSFGTMTIEWRP